VAEEGLSLFSANAPSQGVKDGQRGRHTPARTSRTGSYGGLHRRPSAAYRQVYCNGL